MVNSTQSGRGFSNRAAFFLAASLFLAACGSEQQAGDVTATEQDWRTEETDLSVAISLPVELLGISAERDHFRKAMEERVGMPVSIQTVAGYDGIIQAMASDQVDLVTVGAGAYASLYDLIGEKALPLLAFRGHAGDVGYYSALTVKADSPYNTLEDLEGARLGYVDFNSTSGYIYPRYALRKQGVDVNTFFGETGITGGHIQSVMALDSGQYDAVITLVGGGTPETGFTQGATMLMAEQGLIDGDDFRSIWYAGPIPNSVFVMRSEKDQAFIDLVTGVLAAMPYEEPGALQSFGLRRTTGLVAIPRSVLYEIIEMRAAEIAGDTAQ